MAILATEKVLTLDNWKPASKLSVGDYVFDRKGNLVRIKLIQQYVGLRCYQVKFDDGTTISGDKDLRLPTENHKYRCRIREYKGKFKFRRPLGYLTTEALTEQQLVKGIRTEYSVPTTEPLNFPHMDLPVPPFVFGYWFMSRKPRGQMFCAQSIFDFVLEKFKDQGYLPLRKKSTFLIKPTVESHLIPNIPRLIPANYLFGSAEQRQELLSGIMCARHKWYFVKEKKFELETQNYALFRQIQYLAESIGCRTNISSPYSTNRTRYRLVFKSNRLLVPHQHIVPIKVHHARRYIKQVLPIEPQMCVHFETEGVDNTLLAGEGFISVC